MTQQKISDSAFLAKANKKRKEIKMGFPYLAHKTNYSAGTLRNVFTGQSVLTVRLREAIARALEIQD